MTKRLSRQKLYDLVWSEPMKTLSARFGISDVALKKTCVRADIPTPDRGYWAKKEAGKRTFQVALPQRAPGMDDEVLVAGGGNYWYPDWNKAELLGPLPAPAEFPEPIEAVRERIAKVIGKVAVPRDVRNWHPSIDRLLKEDDKRREKQLVARFPMSWDYPLFDTPFERRRLRILNSLFLAVTRMNGKPTIRGRDAREIHLTFHKQHVGITLDQPKQSNQRGQVVTTSTGASDGKLALSILEGSGSQKERTVWQDDESGKLEARMTDVAVQVVLTAEIQHRESAVRHYQWRVERKAQLEEEERKRKIEAERAERERQRRMEQARIDRLLKDAAAFQQAGEIRKYVELLRKRRPSNTTVSPETFEEWSRWALGQADRIDPSVGDAFLTASKDEDGA